MKTRTLFLLFGTLVACTVTAVHAAKYSKPKAHIKAAVQPYTKTAFRDDCHRDPQIAQKLCYAHARFEPKDLFKNGDPKKKGRCKAANTKQIDRVKKAIELAPQYVKERLYCMRGIFLTTGANFGSWGLWEAPDSQKGNPDRKPNDGKGNNRLFVAISEQAVADDARLDTVQAANLAGLLGLMPGDLNQIAHFEDADDPAWVTLAYLAHELGHILVGLSNADGSDRNHPRTKVGSVAPIDACFETVFLDGSPPTPPYGSWDGSLFHTPRNMTRFFIYGDQGTNKQKNIDFIISNLRGDRTKANTALRALYQSGEFVSGMAAMSPVEHMVATFEFKALADSVPASGMSKPSIKLPGASGAIQLNAFLMGSPPMQRQVDCLNRLGMLTFP